MRVGHTKKTNSIKIAIFNVPAVMFLSDGDEQFLDAVLELFTPGSYIKKIPCLLHAFFLIKKKYFFIAGSRARNRSFFTTRYYYSAILFKRKQETKKNFISFLPASLDGKKHLTLSVVTEKPTTMTKKHKEIESSFQCHVLVLCYLFCLLT